LGDTRAYDGCIRVDVYEDEDSATITLVEEWETLAHQERYLGWRIETGIQEATKDILEGGFDNGVTVHTLGKKVGY
jgi:quinol monooxygenase YgiN